MRTKIDPTKATHIFFPQKDRVCPGCGEPQRYGYKSSGRYFYLLSGLNFLEGQIVCCHNGHCALRYKPMHPAEELAYAPTKKGHGFDVIARVGQHRYGDKLTRLEILARLEKEYPDLMISERQVENLYKLYGKLVSGSTLMDREVIAAMKGNKVIVLSLCQDSD